MKNKIYIFLIALITSCNCYHPKEMIKLGEKTLKRNKLKLDSTIKTTNRIALNHSTLSILTSNAFSEIYTYVDSIKDIDNGTMFEISHNDLKELWNYMPSHDIEEIIVVKDLCVSFEIRQARDDYAFKNNGTNNYGKIIYCFDEDKFKKCFPNYNYYGGNEIGSIPDSVKWVYFYDKNWGITTSSVYLRMDSTECKKILSNEK